MRKFLLDISKEGAPQFIDPRDREKYQKLLSRLRDSGQNKVVMTVQVYVPSGLSDKQLRLFKVVTNLIATESGNSPQEIEDTLLAPFPEAIEDMNNVMFDTLLNHTFEVARTFFGIELTVTDEGFIEQKLN